MEETCQSELAPLLDRRVWCTIWVREPWSSCSPNCSMSFRGNMSMSTPHMKVVSNTWRASLELIVDHQYCFHLGMVKHSHPSPCGFFVATMSGDRILRQGGVYLGSMHRTATRVSVAERRGNLFEANGCPGTQVKKKICCLGTPFARVHAVMCTFQSLPCWCNVFPVDKGLVRISHRSGSIVYPVCLWNPAEIIYKFLVKPSENFGSNPKLHF